MNRQPGSAPLRRGITLIWKSAPGWTAVQIGVLATRGLLPLVALYVLKLIFDAVERALTRGGVSFEQVALLVALAGGVAALAAVLSTVGTVVGELQALELTDTVHDVLHAKAIDIDLEDYETPEYHDTLHRTLQEAPHRPARIVREVAQVAQNGLSLIAIAGLLFSLHWVLALVLFGAALPGLFIKLRFSRRLYLWARRRTPAMRVAHYLHTILTTGVFAKEIRLFGLGPIFRDRFHGIRKTVRQEKMYLVTRRSVFGLIAELFSVVAVFGALAFIAGRTLAGAITLGDMVMYFGAFQRGQDFFREMLSGMAGLYDDNLFLNDLDAFLRLKPKVVEPAHPRPFPRPVQAGIAVRNVTFHYPGSEAVVLRDLSLDIRPGEHVALVGENGSGKTTLVKLLCRLYDPTGGTITVDGIDLREFETSDLRRDIGVIFQDFARYHMPARDNVWFGDVTIDPASDRIQAAAAKTGADQIIERLPQGYDTVLGRQFEEGAELSLGEWQKVALARAFLRETQIIVLDEPTASLDPRSEAQVFDRFRELARGRTAILISHRLSTVRRADRILVLRDGRIVESGVHDQLMRDQGTYAELFEMQARHYR